MEKEEVVVIADANGGGYGFAKGVYEYVKSRSARDFPINMLGVEKESFKDKEFKVKISDNIRRKKCFFIHDSNKAPCEWFTEMAFVLEAMNFSSPSEINIVLPYLRFARQDRKETSRVSVNAGVVADVVSLYAKRGMTVDLHAPQIQRYFRIPFDNLYSFPVLISYLIGKHKEILEDLVVVSPDLGGGKRADALVKRLNKSGIKSEVALGYKTRIEDNKVEKIIIIGNPENKNCLIVDDIIDTGGTLVKTGEALKEKGAKRILAYGTHGLFTEGKEKLKIFDRILVSDTLYNEEEGNLEIVSCVGLFGEAIYRTVRGESLSILFDDKK